MKTECFDLTRVCTFIKKIVKKNLPAPFLKQVFLAANKIKIKTIDRVLFPECKVEEKEFLIYRTGFPFRESGILINDLPEGEVKGYMESWYTWTQEEFLLVFNKPCIIEPEYGWAITGINKLVYYSLGVSRTWFQQKPSIFRYLTRKNSIAISKVISLRDTGEENYFHFYNDVLSKLFFLQQHGIKVQEIPIVISGKLWEKEYFKFFLQHSSFLKTLNWTVQQRDQYIQCDSAIFCKPITHQKELWSIILSPFKDLPVHANNKKIFLTRSKERLRFIENTDEVEAIVKKFGFAIIDTDNLSMKEQITLFSAAEFLVGIHGAGLTNMAFCRGGCRVLELFPPPDSGYLPYHYIMLAKMSGFYYRALIGEPGKTRYSGGFYLKGDQLTRSLVDLGIGD